MIKKCDIRCLKCEMSTGQYNFARSKCEKNTDIMASSKFSLKLYKTTVAGATLIGT